MSRTVLYRSMSTVLYRSTSTVLYRSTVVRATSTLLYRSTWYEYSTVAYSYETLVPRILGDSFSVPYTVLVPYEQLYTPHRRNLSITDLSHSCTGTMVRYYINN